VLLVFEAVQSAEESMNEDLGPDSTGVPAVLTSTLALLLNLLLSTSVIFML
jgi:hypothetical protein